MAKRPKPRRIVIDDVEYHWLLRGGDEYDNYEWLGLRVVPATSPTGVKSVLWISLSRTTLILPSYVRRLILEARAAGWDPYASLPAGFRFQPKAGPYPDEPDPKKPQRANSDEPTPKLEVDLLASVREAEETDDAPRLVYADWLMQGGEPSRGEYINLACTAARGQLAPAQEERMRALFEENQWKWLGAIGDVTSSRRWSRGLVEDVLIDRRSRGVVEPAIGDPGWLAVRRVDTRGRFMVASDIARIVAHPVLRHLDALATTSDVLSLLVAADAVPDVEELTVAWGLGAGGGGDASKALLQCLPRLIDSRDAPRRLERLLIPDGIPREQLLSAIDDPHLTLTVVSSLSGIGEWLDELNRHSSTAVRELHIARSLTLMFEPLSFEVIVRYDERTGRYTRVHLRWTTTGDQWAQNEIRMGIDQLGSEALTVLSGEGPLGNVGNSTHEWIRDLRTAARNQRSVSFEGVFA